VGLVFGKVVALSVEPESSERSRSRADPAGKVGAVFAQLPISTRSLSMLDILVLESNYVSLFTS
jgi:hypothetical protein